jgi:hypothetical protein
MDEEVIAHIRDRVRRVRRIAAMAHDPEMIAMLNALAEEGEADLRKLEARKTGEAIVPPADHGSKAHK